MMFKRGVALIVVFTIPASALAQDATLSPDTARVRRLLAAPPSSLDLETALMPAVQVDSCDVSHAQGRRDADINHKSTAWWSTAIAGFFLPLIGIGVSTVIAFGSRPEPKAIASNVDVECYKDGYGGRARKKNVLTALTASALGTVAIVALVAASGGFVVFPAAPAGMTQSQSP